MRDELFGLKFQSALRLYRRVEVLIEYKVIPGESEGSSEKFSEDSSGNKETVMQRWVDVTTEGQLLELPFKNSIG